MRNLLAFVLSVCLSFSPLSVQPLADFQKSTDSTARLDIHILDGRKGSCTAFSINEEEGYWMTAAHCTTATASYRIRGTSASPVMVSHEWDIAVFRGPVGVPALKFSKKPPKVGDEVYMPTYVGGIHEPWVLFARIIRLYDPYMGRELWTANMMLVGQTGPGASGGPIINQDDKVVSIVQGKTSGNFVSVIFGIPWEQLYPFVITYGEN